MKLGVKFSLTTIIIIFVNSILLESLSLLVFSNTIHSLNKGLFSEKVERMVRLAYEQDELLFEDIYEDESDAQLRVKEKFKTIYREQKDKVSFPVVITTEGELIAHPELPDTSIRNKNSHKPNIHVFDNDTIRLMKLKKEGEVEYVSNGVKKWCVFKTYEPWNWIFCMTTSVRKKNEAITSFMWFSLIACTVIVILSVLVILIMVRKYTRPLSLIIKRFKDFTIEGVESVKEIDENFGKNIEINTLTNSFNKMVRVLGDTTISKDYFDDILSSMLDLLIVIDVDRYIKLVNNSVCNLLEYEESELVDKLIDDIFPQLANISLEQQISQTEYQRRDRLKYETRTTLMTKNSKKMLLSLSVANMYDSKDQISGFVFVMRDIRNLVEQEEKLIEREKDKERQLWVNKAKAKLANNMLGIFKTEELSKKILNTISSELEVSVGAVYVLEEEQQKVLKLQASYAVRDRNKVFDEFRLGEGMVGEAALMKKSLLFADVKENNLSINYGLGEAVPRYYFVIPIIFEDKVKAVLVLGTIEKFSYQQRSFLDQATVDIGIAFNLVQSQERIEILLADVQKQAEILKDSEDKLKVQQEELQVTNEELEAKTERLETQKREIETKNVDLEMASREIEIKAEQLEEVSRYKSEFLANMSHELRTPLNSLLVLAKAFADDEDGNLTEDQIESAKVIYSSGTDLLGLINEVLDLSKIEAGEMNVNIVKVTIQDVVLSMRRNFSHIAQDKGVVFEVEYDKKKLPETITTDAKKLAQVLKNLLSNAFKFTDASQNGSVEDNQEGKVILKISRPSNNVKFSTKELKEKGAIAFSVIDNGIGIPKDKHKQIFEAFKQADGTTSRKYGGTGLGLSISQKFAHVLGGEIQVDSIFGAGSTFTLYVPENMHKVTETIESSVVHKPVAPIETKALPEDDYQVPQQPSPLVDDDRATIKKSDQTVLIIEDDPRFSKILLDEAHKKGFKAILADKGNLGVDMALEFQPKAIILDIMLPEMDGWGVLERLKNHAKTRHIPVHIISALEENIQAFKKGSIGYVTKPVNKDDIDKVFDKFGAIISDSLRHLVVLDPNDEHRKDVVTMMKAKDVNIVEFSTAKETYTYLLSNECHCLITALDLPDMSLYEFLDKLHDLEATNRLPILVINPGEGKESTSIERLSNDSVIKEVKSDQRLLDEAVLFLHKVEEDLPKKQQETIRMLHDGESLLKGKRVLVVDDDMRNTFTLSKILKKKGMEVLMAENGEKALQCLDKTKDIDLVLMDIMMPIMDGYEAIRKIRSQDKFSQLPILALTANAMAGDREKCIEAGASDYLIKPVDVEKLFSMMRVWLYQ